MSNPYFTFPLCLLSYGPDYKSRLEHIISHSVIRVGRHAAADPAKADETLRHITNHPTDYMPSDPSHRIVMLGRGHFRITGHSIAGMIRENFDCEEFISQYEGRNGTDALVMVHPDFVWACKGGGDPDWRHLSTLCGILSIIGKKETPIRITREMIIARQLGYKSVEVMKKELLLRYPKRADKAKPLSIQQCRDVLTDLEAGGFFVRCHPTPRATYFSTCMEREAMVDAVMKMLGNKDKVKEWREEERKLFKGKSNGNHNGTAKEPLKKEKAKKNHYKTKGEKGTTTEPKAEPQQEPQQEPLNNIPLITSLEQNPSEEGGAPAKNSDSEAEPGGEQQTAPSVEEVRQRIAEFYTDLDPEGISTDEAAQWVKDWFEKYGKSDWTKEDWKAQVYGFVFVQYNRKALGTK